MSSWNGIWLVSIFIDVCLSGICVICMICTCLSVGVHDLQDPHDLPERNLCEVYDLYTGTGYARSARSAHIYRWVCMICRICMIRGICMICGVCVWSGVSVKYGYFTLVYSMFRRHGLYEVDISHVPERDLCDLYIFIGCDLYVVRDVYDLHDPYHLQDLYDLPEWNMLICMICTSWPGWSLYHLQDFYMICRICIICMIYLSGICFICMICTS